MLSIDFSKIMYICSKISRPKSHGKSIEVIGLDTEAYTTGRCFLLATSLKDTFHPDDFPQCFFNRTYRGANFVTYNLSYDEGALLQRLPVKVLNRLREGERVKYKGFFYHIIPKKCLTVSRNRNTIHVWDMYNFYTGSLRYNAETYLGENKLEIETVKFTPGHVKKNRSKIKAYCIRDAVLVKRLADLLISKFEKYGVYPRKLYSTAYVSYQYFRSRTPYVTVKRYWENDKKVIYYAMCSYNGGKFEVTEKGTGHFYEYDIISAYPYEIANLIDITGSRVVYSDKYRPAAKYGFIHCKIKIPVKIYSPIALKYHGVNIYPAGEIEKVITKNEYDYLLLQGCDITILDCAWLHCDRVTYPYRREIKKLVVLKQQYKKSGDKLDYHTMKIFLNSLYGKFVQLIKHKDYYRASTCWNPIYGSIITSNVRLRVSALQQKYPDIIAVHTDSIISKKKLPFPDQGILGDFTFECQGKGLIIGSGVYQIGDKVKFRGFTLKTSLFPIVDTPRRYISINETHAYTWREVVFRNWSRDQINRFNTIKKKVDINFDRKRLWLADYRHFKDILKRNVLSLPIYSDSSLV